MTGFEVVIVVFDPGTKLHLFDLNVVLLLLRLPGRTLRLVLVLAVVHELDHGRPSLGRHFDEIKTAVIGEVAGVFDRNDTDLPALVVDQTNGADPYLLIYTNSFLANITLPLTSRSQTLSVKKPDLSGYRGRESRTQCLGFHFQDPAVSNVSCGTERWSRVCIGSLPSCLSPRTQGSKKISGM